MLWHLTLLLHFSSLYINVLCFLGTDGQEILLSVIKVDGPPTAAKEAEEILKVSVYLLPCDKLTR